MLTILCHPREGSLCHAVARRCELAGRRAGVAVTAHDLYREGLNPVLTAEELDRGFSFDEQIQAYVREVARSSLLVFVHPEWWGQPPALLKGWIDRVLRPGVAYDVQSPTEDTRRQVPLLGGRRALVFCTTDAAVATGSLETLWTKGVFEFCGIRDVAVSVLPDVRGSTHAGRQEWLANAERAVIEAAGALAQAADGRAAG